MDNVKYLHPLSEIYPAGQNGFDEESMNTWASASIIVSIIADKPNSKVLESFRIFVHKFDSSLDCNLLIEKVKSGDESTIWQCINWVHEGMTLFIHEQLGYSQ